MNGEKISERDFDSKLKSSICITKGNYWQDFLLFVDQLDRLWVLALPMLEIVQIQLLQKDIRRVCRWALIEHGDIGFQLMEDGEVRKFNVK